MRTKAFIKIGNLPGVWNYTSIDRSSDSYQRTAMEERRIEDQKVVEKTNKISLKIIELSVAERTMAENGRTGLFMPCVERAATI